MHTPAQSSSLPRRAVAALVATLSVSSVTAAEFAYVDSLSCGRSRSISPPRPTMRWTRISGRPMAT